MKVILFDGRSTNYTINVRSEDPSVIYEAVKKYAKENVEEYAEKGYNIVKDGKNRFKLEITDLGQFITELWCSNPKSNLHETWKSGMVDIENWQNKYLFKSDPEVVEMAIQLGADVSHFDENGFTPLMVASVTERLEVVKELLKHSPNINARCTRLSSSALMYASMNGCLKVVTELLKHSPDINIQNKHGHTAVLQASMYGHTEVVIELLKHSPNIDFPDMFGHTALSYASSQGHSQIVKQLEEYKNWHR